AEPDGFHSRGLQIEPRRGIKVERRSLLVEIPFTRRVEFLEDVLDEAILIVHAHAAVVLPAALIGDVAVCVLARDHVVEIAPHIAMHRVYVPAAWILPPGGALFAERIWRPAIEIRRSGIVIRIASKRLAAAVHKQ